MLSYLIKRILLFIPTLLLISVVAFFLGRIAPGDPIELYLEGTGESIYANEKSRDRAYASVRRRLGTDKVPFYFAFKAAAYPDTLYRILTRIDREHCSVLIQTTGNWEKVNHYRVALKTLHQKSLGLPDSLGKAALVKIRKRLKDLRYESDTSIINEKLFYHKKDIEEAALGQFFEPWQSELDLAYTQMLDKPSLNKLYQPKFVWYGFDNQYHNWLKNMFKGHLGYSYADGLLVKDKIGRALRWTILINTFALLIAYGFSIFLGVFLSLRKDKAIDRSITLFLFFLYSLPSFWVATLLLIFFMTPDYGMQILSITEISDLRADAPFSERFVTTAKHIVLPVFSLAYGLIAFITLQMRGAMVDVLGKDFIRTAYSKGLPKKKIIWKHAFRNALFPIITIFGALFPATIAGSVVIENIFNIPGMGDLMIKSIDGQDWPVVYIIMLISTLLTIIGILVSDILYAVADPRIRFKSK